MTVYADLQTALATINTTVQKASADLFQNPQEGVYKAYCEPITSGSSLNQIVQPGANAKLRQWTGAKQFKSFRAYAQTHETVPYEASMKLTRKEVQYDKSGIVQRRISSFLSSQADAYDRLASAALIANGTGLDGVSLFSSSHPWATAAGGTQANTGTNSLSLSNLEACRTAGAALTFENGEYMGVDYDTVICGPTIIRLARDICEAKDRIVATNAQGAEATSFVVDTSAMQNTWQGVFRVVEDKRLVGSYAYYWYMLDSKFSGGEKPLVLIESDPLHVTAKDKPTDDNAFHSDEYLWSVTGDLVIAPFCWMSIYGNLATS